MSRSDCVLIQQASGDHRKLLALTQHLHNRYTERHGMDYWATHGEPSVGLGKRHAYWAKVALVRQAVEAGYRYVIWLDADTLIVTDEDLRLACPDDGIGMTWHEMDWDAIGAKGAYDHFNAGAFYVGVGSQAKRTIDAWWKEPDGGHPWFDQHAINRLEKAKPGTVTRIDHRYNSVYPHFMSERPAVLAWHGHGNLEVRLHAMNEAVTEASYAPRHIGAPSPEQAFAVGKQHEGRGDYEAAAAMYRAALTFTPNDPEILRSIANCHIKRKRWDLALPVLKQVTGFYPKDSHGWIQVAGCYEYLGEHDLCGEAIIRALECSPRAGGARWNFALWLLKEGRWEAGWSQYEWGVLCKGRALRTLGPIWSGEPVNTLFLWSEQGIGDTLQFCRFAPEILRRGLAQEIILEVQETLVPLLSGQWDGVTVRAQAKDGDTPEYDAHLGLMSLGRVLSVTPDNLESCCASSVPYLIAPQAKRDDWNRRMGGKFRVGFAWKGAKDHGNDCHRSIGDPEIFDNLIETPKTEWWCLQTEVAVPEETKAEGLGCINFVGDELFDWTDTAAAIASCDLVITVDTAIAHLAGALGIPCWILLSKSSDWRWLLGREDSVWYPNTRLFRQDALNEWEPVLARVQDALCAMAGSTPADTAPIVTRDCKYGQMTFNKNDVYLGRSLQCYGEFSEGEVDLFRRVVKPGDTVLDVGANIGCLTVPLARIVGENGAVAAFEPVYENSELLAQNIHGNGIANVKIMRFALGAEAREGDQPVGLWHGEALHNSGGHALPDEAPVRRLDDMLGIERCDFIKIDVEGMERDVLLGARETIAKFKPVLFVENDRGDKSEDLIALLEELGYSCFWHVSPLYNPDNWRQNQYNAFGNIHSFNMLCAPEGREALAEGLLSVRGHDPQEAAKLEYERRESRSR